MNGTVEALKSLIDKYESLENAFTSLHADTIKSEREMVEALSRFTAGEISNEDLEKARHCKLTQKIKFEVGELLECLERLKVLYECQEDERGGRGYAVVRG